MLRFIKLVLMAILMIAIVVLALANREMVTLEVLPDGVASILPVPPSVDLPLFAVILGSILIGLLLGYIFEWLREHKHRRTAAARRREASQLRAEVETLKRKHMSEEDEVLAIIDQNARNA